MVATTRAPRAGNQPDIGGTDGEDAAEEDSEEIGIEASGEADQHHGQGEAAGEKDGERGVALECPVRAEPLHAQRAYHRDDERAHDRGGAHEEPDGHSGEGHVGQRIGDERETARYEKDPDERADDGHHRSGGECSLHKAKL
jgi:hypothetical protein